MTHPKPTRRDFLKAASVIPLAAIPVASAAVATVKPPPTTDLLSAVALTANAVARRPLRLCAVAGPTLSPVCWPTKPVEPGELPISPFWLAEAQTLVELTEHPLIDAVCRFRGLGSGDLSHVHNTAIDLQLYGRAYWAACEGQCGVPSGFYHLEAHKMHEVCAKDGSPTNYAYDPQGISGHATYVGFDARDVIRFRRLFHGNNPFIDPKDLDGLKIETKSIEQIANEHNIPIAMLRPERASRKAMEAATIQHERNAVDPLCRLIASTLTDWTHAQPVAKKRGWDRLFWGFDLSDDQITRSREEKP